MDPYTNSVPDPYADNYSAPPPAPATNEGRSPLPPARGRSRSASPPRNNGSEYRSERNGGRSPRRPSHAPSAPAPSNVLGVFGLSIRSQERDLDDEFSRYGRVEKVTIVYDQRSGRSRGFGFIRMATVEDASKCVQELNGIELNGRRIRVDFSVTERPHNPTPGEYMGHRRSGGDNYRGGRDSYRERRDDHRDRDRDYGRDHGRDRDRDPYGRDSRDWRDRRSPPPARGGGGRYSPEPRRRRSYSRSPVRGSDRDRRDYGDSNGDRYSRY